MALLRSTLLFVSFALFVKYCSSQIELSWDEVTSPSLPQATSGLLAGFDSIADRIWLLGGWATGGNSIWYYSISNNTFVDTQTSLPHSLEVSGQSYTQMGSDLYYAHSDSLYKFSLTNGAYDAAFAQQKQNSFPIPNRDSPCLANDGRFIFVLGGIVGIHAAQQLQIYDTINDLWATPIDFNSARARSSCAVSPDADFLYVFGGTYNGLNPLNNSNTESSVEVLNIGDKSNVSTINDGTWTQIRNEANSLWIMLANFYYARAVTVGDYIYLLGGRDDNDVATNAVQIFDPASNTLQLTTPSKTGRSTPGVVAVRGTIYSFGGTNSAASYVASWERSNVLTAAPTLSPTSPPTDNPSLFPSLSPITSAPTKTPTDNPSNQPSVSPTAPTKKPTSAEGAVATEDTSPQNSETISSTSKSDKAVSGNSTDWSTIAVIGGSLFGGCVFCILVVMLFQCHLKNKRLSQELQSRMEQSNHEDDIGLSSAAAATAYEGVTTDPNVTPHAHAHVATVAVVSRSVNTPHGNEEAALNEIPTARKMRTLESDAGSYAPEGAIATVEDLDLDDEHADEIYAKPVPPTGGENEAVLPGKTSKGKEDATTAGPENNVQSTSGHVQNDDADESESDEDEAQKMYGRGKTSKK